MPIYEYALRDETQEGCEHCKHGFEAIQRMSEDALEACPHCGTACKRVLSAFGVNANSTRDMLSNKNLEKNGFTKYKKAGDGVYEKVTGQGPRYIQK